jgi:hypothetical protein
MRDNIKMDLMKFVCEGMYWNDLVHDRDIADCCERGNELSGYIK